MRYLRNGALDHCHIVPQGNPQIWALLKQQGKVPLEAKSVQHECRNELLMFKICHYGFDNLQFYVQFVPERQDYVFVNPLQYQEYTYLHDRRLRLDTTNPRSPLPYLFYWHEGVHRVNYPDIHAVITTAPTKQPSLGTRTASYTARKGCQQRG
ncbi:hypothetical protein BDD12DRAFT_850778 [Trichophaea hybrida]|nr:hypothetical protein BDD12DRAFT_850778 [Trichophaea hybrida]